MTRRDVQIEELVTASLGAFLADDPEGLAAVLDAIEDLGDDPFPQGAVQAGRRTWRLWVGRYRVQYAVTDTEVRVGHVGRL